MAQERHISEEAGTFDSTLSVAATYGWVLAHLGYQQARPTAVDESKRTHASRPRGQRRDRRSPVAGIPAGTRDGPTPRRWLRLDSCWPNTKRSFNAVFTKGKWTQWRLLQATLYAVALIGMTGA